MTSDKYCQNLVAAGCEFENLFSLANTILLSTLLFKNNKPKNLNSWWYYAKEHVQHISFYSENTFRFLAKKFNCKIKIIKATKSLNFVLLERKNQFF